MLEDRQDVNGDAQWSGHLRRLHVELEKQTVDTDETGVVGIVFRVMATARPGPAPAGLGADDPE